ncbi:myo-inositol-1(or 4)-monophosphatase [Kribbella voronezhensis]|uniref:Inositol-1-monophosphatase n=1 Tax=Kribbella voronezhensis TaxID=2512212 RepID=A0A4R7TE09_9ACTN|nr:inositol monophosphatase family protein [Kribbella voronezhensis]TDU90380.1 myo-inositol-1(or 4)-monophosphatase [Kribbella voronezhensis]
MRTADVNELLALAVTLATAAGAELLARQTAFSIDGPAVETKSSASDPVTAADRASEKLITDGLAAARPEDGLLGEEGAAKPSVSGITWVIDPLDGTVNYLYGRPDWAVSIAAEDDAGALVGVVHQPRTGLTWQAVRDGGATRNGVRLEVRESRGPAAALVSTGFSYLAERRAEQAEYLRRVLPAVRDLRRGGSAALDLCAVADGTVDAYYEHVIQRWDVAAGGLVAREAGAQTVGGPGTPLPDGVLAASPALADALLDLLEPWPSL